MAKGDMREARTRMQMIFQDPISSLNPRRKVRDIVMEPLTIWKRGSSQERGELVDKTLEEVGIDPTAGGREPGRTSSPVASASASRSPGRWCSIRA